jgi:uncharacterized protein (DUF885 family)
VDESTEQFYRDVDQYLAWLMEVSPTAATHLGVHDYDDRLADLSIASLDEQHRMNQRYLARFESAQGAEDKDTRVDAALMASMLHRAVRAYERVRHRYRMPRLYLGECTYGAYSLLAKDFAPLPDRLCSLAGRLSEVPRVLEQGKRNLDRPPRIWTEIAISQARGGVEFFERTVPAAAAQEPGLTNRVVEASQKAADAAKRFVRFLEDDLLPRSDGEFPVGEELWNTMVRDEHMLEADADQIERTGHELIAETRKAMAEAAARIAPGTDAAALLKHLRNRHPEAGELLNAYRAAMNASRQFVIDHDLVSVPAGEALDIQETPPFSRPTMPFAAYVSPGPFEKQQQGIFWVTPVDPDLPEDQRETRLRGHPSGKIPVIAVHEGYPGHHLQLVRGNHAATLPRKVGGSTLFVEGWAFYCEAMMEEEGFLTDPESKLLRLADQLWRACRIVIDVGLHTRGMSIQQAIRMLVDVAGLEEPDATAEVHRYTQSPTQPMCYLIGKLEILKIAQEYRARSGSSFNLKTFHDELLSFGSLTPKLIRTMLFE